MENGTQREMKSLMGLETLHRLDSATLSRCSRIVKFGSQQFA